MSRAVKSRRRTKRANDPEARAARALEVVKMRRYLAFVRAVVGVSLKAGSR